MSETTLHPFYKAGLGEGPYRFVGCFDMGEAMNPNSAANFGNMRGWVANAPKLEAGLGTCTVCGMGIMIICIVKNAAGKLYGVGSDCIEKCDDNGTPLHSISDRARHILADIKGKNAGRSGSKAYEAAYQQAITLLFPKP